MNFSSFLTIIIATYYYTTFGDSGFYNSNNKVFETKVINAVYVESSLDIDGVLSEKH